MRTGISSVLTIDGKNYVVDAGRSAVTQYLRAGLEFKSLEAMFVTHLHADHIADYYNFFLLGGNVTNDSGDNLSGPVAVFGPGSAGALPPPKEPNSPTVSPADPTPGISRMTSDLTNAYAYSHNIFIRETAIRDVNTLIQVRDIELPSNTGASALGDTAPAMRPFTVMEDSRTRVSAILVPHGPVFPSYAFRFDTDYGSVVFSGDTRTSGNVSTLAKGADVLVHEVINLPFYQQQGLPEPLIEHFRQAHTPDTEVGGVAHDAGVESLVLSHLVPSNPRWVSDEQYTKNARSGYGGSVVVGRDLMKIDVKKNAPANVVARPTA
ncbi:MBL fold metallo-hydrolase [Gordonia polyisoprenivorans]|uniref:MBL fold metallo-hydrolase n=1 Tax=Gordonia polyisoprenivorans TaxID=84595 RepID=UPI00036CAEBF|nr:MBL fold metallo-hydrolase [Gordonia polyisoprenivorans]QUD84245.1 MBL fold metallo-hydrolase [Gordonia polyisoprenivorans]